MTKKTIAVICGTRPEAIKLIPLYLTLKPNPLFNTILVSSGQHQDMLNQVFALFEVTPEYSLNTMQKGQSLGELTGRLFFEIDKLFKEIKPNLAIVQGDTSTAMVGNMVAFYHQIKIAHIEAGLRTYNKYSPFPEEINRQIIGLTADFHFTPTPTASSVLKKENKNNIYEVGNTVIDALLIMKDKVVTNLSKYEAKYNKIVSSSRNNILITSHRRENFEHGLSNICNAIVKIANKYSDEANIIFPVHLNPIVQKQVNTLLANQANIHLIKPVPYDELIYLMNESYMILTDSGGIQEEAPALNKPIIVLRTTTERPEGVEAGCAVLVGNKEDDIYNSFESIYNSKEKYQRMALSPCPYGNGTACTQINSILSENLFE